MRGGVRGLGAGHGEIPAASAGMTELFCAGGTEGARGAWVLDTAGYPRRGAGMTDLARAGVTDLILRGCDEGAPLDVWGWAGALLCGCGRRRRGLGAGHGEIPAASAGMTELCCAGVADLFCVWALEVRRRMSGAGVGRCCAGVGGGGGAWVLGRVGYPRRGAGMTDLARAGVPELILRRGCRSSFCARWRSLPAEGWRR